MRVNIFPRHDNEPPRLQIFEQDNPIAKVDYELSNEKLTMLIKKLVDQLPDEIPKSANVYKTEEKLKQLVVDEFDLQSGDLWKRTKNRNIARPRQVLMYLLKKHCKYSSSEIATTINLQRTNVIYAVNQVENLLTHGDRISEHITIIEENLQNWQMFKAVA